MKAVVSVVLPVYNGMLHLPEAVASIQAQTHSAWELVIVDDGSRDGSPAFLQAAAQSDPRLQLYTHRQNQGIAAAYNTGLQHAQGRWVAFQEQDDVSHPQRLAQELDHLIAAEAGAVAAEVAFIDAQGAVWYNPPITPTVTLAAPNPAMWRHSFEGDTFPHNTTLMLDRERLAPDQVMFDERFRRCGQDLDFYLRVLWRHRFTHLGEVLVGYRRYPGLASATANTQAMIPDMRRLLRKHQRYLGQRLGWAAARTWARGWSNEFHAEAASFRRSWRGLLYGGLSLILWPTNPRAWHSIRRQMRAG